jgi:hypothetical protein
MNGASPPNHIGISIVLVLFSFVFYTSVSNASDQGNISAGLAVYSDLSFIESEREYAGLQVSIVPYHGGQKILWRSAGPFLDEPILLDAVKDGSVFKVVVPEDNDLSGYWNLILDGDVINAAGPRGLKYKLKKISVK